MFLEDVYDRIKDNGFSSNGNSCDADLVSFLKEAHERGIRVYALFAASDEAFSETSMASLVPQFNSVCGDELSYFDGVSVNNEYFSKVRECSDENEKAQIQFLTDLNTTVHNSLPLPLHFSVSWNWDCCDCGSEDYKPRYLTWNGATKTALAHMIDLVDSVDVQVAYNLPEVMEARALPPYEYWMEKPNKSSTSALYVLAYANPNEEGICQLSFAPQIVGSSTVPDTCSKGNINRTEESMFEAFDYIENKLPGAIGGIHYMGGVFSTGIIDSWPKHDLKEYSCALHQKYNPKKDKCVNRCRKGNIWTSKVCKCACPSKCKKKKKNGKCKSRCTSGTQKWRKNAKVCIPIDDNRKGYIWNESTQLCVLT